MSTTPTPSDSTQPHLDARIDWRNAEDEAAWVSTAVDAVVAALQRDLDTHGRALLLLSGGSTPGPVYRALAQVALDWANVDVALVDDRWVASDAATSNARLARETLLQGAAARARFWPLVVDASDTTRSAMAAAADAANAHWQDAGWVPSIAVLGMGDDGHTASLFPGSDGLAHALATDAPYASIDATGCPGAGQLPLRISLTAAGLASARQRLLLLRGDTKRAVLAQAAAPGPVEDLPVRAAFAQTLQVLWCA